MTAASGDTVPPGCLSSRRTGRRLVRIPLGILRQSLNILTFALYRTALAGMENALMLPIREQRLMMEIERYMVAYQQES